MTPAPTCLWTEMDKQKENTSLQIPITQFIPGEPSWGNNNPSLAENNSRTMILG